MIDARSLAELPSLLLRLQQGMKGCAAHTQALSPADIEVLHVLVDRLHDTDPYFSPNYMGHMSSYVHPVASAAYMLAMQLNSNNHSYDGGRATTMMEQACMSELAGMFGWHKVHGHLCGGGTVANFEGLWAARSLGYDTVIASRSAHYCHERNASILGMRFIGVDVDVRHQMRLDSAKEALCQVGRSVMIATCGTTAVGAIDPIAELAEMAHEYGARMHVDAAYGGYYAIIADELPSTTARHLRAIGRADSVVIDPHKHGLQGFGCGAVLFREDTEDTYCHDAPYTYTNSNLPHFGKISFECSRPGAVAAALWATMQRFPLMPGSAFAARLATCHEQAIAFHNALLDHPRYMPVTLPETDIVCLTPRIIDVSSDADKSREIVERDVATLKQAGLYVALMRMKHNDVAGPFCIRCVMMKPEHSGVYSRVLDALSC
jgi:tyrosine decarboxylase/aspartate 1-decarboxylase